MVLAIVIFVVTYAFIAGSGLSFLPIGRPAGALVGACAFVVLSLFVPTGLTPHEAFAAIDLDTIGMLFGMMVLAAGLVDGGASERWMHWLLSKKPSPVALLYAVTIGSGVLSALLLNDSVCLLFAPLVDRTATKLGLHRLSYLLALAMGANSGSAMTLAGNPQNMLVAQLSGISYRSYLAVVGPAGLASLIATAIVLHLLFAKRLVIGPPADGADLATTGRSPARALVVLVAVSIAFVAGGNLAWSAICGATAMVLLRGRDAAPLFAKVSWGVLLFFGALFIVVAGLEKAHVPEAIFDAVAPHLPRSGVLAVLSLSGMLVVGCQVISNVPFILLTKPLVHGLSDPRLAWMVVGLVSTLAGNLTLLGSVANVIVIEAAGAHKEMGFKAYLKVGAPVTFVSIAVGLAVLGLTYR